MGDATRVARQAVHARPLEIGCSPAYAVCTASNESIDHHDYENEPIGGGNPYNRCIHCKRSDPEIDGHLQGHLVSCAYRQAKESGRPCAPFADIEGMVTQS